MSFHRVGVAGGATLEDLIAVQCAVLTDRLLRHRLLQVPLSCSTIQTQYIMRAGDICNEYHEDCHKRLERVQALTITSAARCRQLRGASTDESSTSDRHPHRHRSSQGIIRGSRRSRAQQPGRTHASAIFLCEKATCTGTHQRSQHLLHSDTENNATIRNVLRRLPVEWYQND